jgi:hypothetical protein
MVCTIGAAQFARMRPLAGVDPHHCPAFGTGRAPVVSRMEGRRAAAASTVSSTTTATSSTPLLLLADDAIASTK